MIKFQSIVLSFCFLTSFSTVAGGRDAGNGGDVIVCAGRTPEMLDIVEARQMRNFTFAELDRPTANIGDRVRNRLARLQAVDSLLSDDISTWALPLALDMDAFLFEGRENGVVASFSDSRLEDVDDSKELLIPEGCEKKQVAIQIKPISAGQVPFYFDSSIVREMSKGDIVSLVLHEAIFKTFVIRGAVNSIQARYLNSWLASSEFPVDNFIRYCAVVSHLDEVQLESILYRGMKFDRRKTLESAEGNTVTLELERWVKASNATPKFNSRLELKVRLTANAGGIRENFEPEFTPNGQGMTDLDLQSFPNGLPALPKEAPRKDREYYLFLNYGVWEQASIDYATGIARFKNASMLYYVNIGRYQYEFAIPVYMDFEVGPDSLRIVRIHPPKPSETRWVKRLRW